jgi:hypothetical protein
MKTTATDRTHFPVPSPIVLTWEQTTQVSGGLFRPIAPPPDDDSGDYTGPVPPPVPSPPRSSPLPHLG